MDNSQKKATVEYVVCDQGNGGSYCGLCSFDLTHESYRLGDRCKKCQAVFSQLGDFNPSFGGSDF